MKQFSAKFFLAFGLVIGLFAFNACQKDGFTPKEAPEGVEPGVAVDRGPIPITYGISVFDGVNPSLVIGIDNNTGNSFAPVPAFILDPSGVPVALDNLTGICLTQYGRYIVSTGSPAGILVGTSVYDNSLYYLNPVTGQCVAFNSTCPFGPVSDIEYNPVNNSVVALMNNSNSIIEILPDIFGNPTLYQNPIPVAGIAPGSTLKGLSIVRDGAGDYFVGCANRTGAAGVPTSLYNLNIATGAATFMTSLLPASDFAGGHCGLGFDVFVQHLAINRRNPTSAPPGLNHITPWLAPPGFPNTGTVNWGTQGFDFEDLTSWIY